MIPLTKIDTIVGSSRWKENVSKDGEENLETHEEKRSARLKNHRPRETLIPPLLSHSTDIISLFIYPPDGSSFKKGKLNEHGGKRWEIARFNKGGWFFSRK